MVSQTARSLVGSRVSTGQSSRDCGHNVPHQNGRCVAINSGSPTCQPNCHHSANTITCDASRHTSHACGWRGGQSSRTGFGMDRIMPGAR